MYKAGSTNIPGMSRRTFRVSGLGVYTPNEFVVPTWSTGVMQCQNYPFMGPSAAISKAASSVGTTPAPALAIPTPAGAVAVRPDKRMMAPAAPAPHAGTSALGQIDFSTLTSNPLFWAAALLGGYFFFFRGRRG